MSDDRVNDARLGWAMFTGHESAAYEAGLRDGKRETVARVLNDLRKAVAESYTDRSKGELVALVNWLLIRAGMSK